MKKAIVIDEERVKKNVFTGRLKIAVTKVSDFGKFVPGADGISLPIFHYIERDQAAKLYYAPGVRAAIYSLSPAAKSLFLFMFCNLESGKDYILLNKQAYMTKNGVKSINTVKKAIQELWDKEFISPTSAYPKDVYWINSTYFFRGSRPNKYPDNLIIKSEISK